MTPRAPMRRSSARDPSFLSTPNPSCLLQHDQLADYLPQAMDASLGALASLAQAPARALSGERLSARDGRRSAPRALRHVRRRPLAPSATPCSSRSLAASPAFAASSTWAPTRTRKRHDLRRRVPRGTRAGAPALVPGPRGARESMRGIRAPRRRARAARRLRRRVTFRGLPSRARLARDRHRVPPRPNASRASTGRSEPRGGASGGSG